MVLLTAAFVVHVVSAGLWTGATLYVAYAILPAARAGRFGPEAFVEQLHRLLLINRWTGLALPATGAYMIWELYTPLWLLFDTQRGWAVLAMVGLWGAMNTLIEVGVLRARSVSEESVGIGEYMQEGFPADAVGPGTELSDLVARARPYVLASGACAALLLADAALLAGGLPV